MEYPKIHSVFKRDDRGRFTSEFSRDAFEYLYDNDWEATEKIDGTNIRIIWNADLHTVEVRGKTDRAQIPDHLHQVLLGMFGTEKFIEFEYPSMTIFGEGFGPKIQKGGKYLEGDPSFILFDIYLGSYWLRRTDMMNIGSTLGIPFTVRSYGFRTLGSWVVDMRTGEEFKSAFGDFLAEGLVLRPRIPLFDHQSHRVITKIKYKDFK
jgi:hypothetical protein